MPVKRLTLSETLRAQMLDHAGRCLPEEACGLIAGRQGLGVLCLPVTNALHSPTAYNMRPVELLAAFERIEAAGLELLAIFHSHPAGPQCPSATDLAQFAYPGVWTIILSPGAQGWQARAYLIHNRQAAEHPILWQTLA